MSLYYRVDRKRKVVLTLGQGTVTAKDFRTYVGTLLIDRNVRSGFSELFDVRYVTKLAIPIREMVVAAGIIQAFSKGIKDTKTALVVSRDNVKEFTRVYRLLRVSVPATVRLFNDVGEARAWLDIPGDTEVG